MSEPSVMDRHVLGAVSALLLQGEKLHAVCVIADYREECVRAERERILAAVKGWRQNWAASVIDEEADDALDELIEKLRGGR